MGGLTQKLPQFLDKLFDLRRINLVTVGDKSYNCSSKIKLIDKTTWLKEARNSPVKLKEPKGWVN